MSSQEAAPINDGGPAFARPFFMSADSAEYSYAQEGMSLRDYFAAKAPVSVSDVKKLVPTFDMAIDGDRMRLYALMAEMRYEYADAMIAAREGGSK